MLVFNILKVYFYILKYFLNYILIISDKYNYIKKNIEKNRQKNIKMIY